MDTGVPIPLYFLDGAMDLPYIESEDIPGMILMNLGDPNGSYTYTSASDGPVLTITRENTNPGAVDNGANAVFDFENDTITFSDHDLFCWKPGTSAIMESILSSRMGNIISRCRH